MATRYPNGLSTYDEHTDSYGTAAFGDTYINGDATISGYVRGNIKLGVLTDIDCTNDVTLTGDQKKARVILVTTVGSGKKTYTGQRRGRGAFITFQTAAQMSWR